MTNEPSSHVAPSRRLRLPDLQRDLIFMTLRSVDHHPIEARLRLRGAVKRLLRDYGFEVRELTTEPPSERANDDSQD